MEVSARFAVPLRKGQQGLAQAGGEGRQEGNRASASVGSQSCGRGNGGRQLPRGTGKRPFPRGASTGRERGGREEGGRREKEKSTRPCPHFLPGRARICCLPASPASYQSWCGCTEQRHLLLAGRKTRSCVWCACKTCVKSPAVYGIYAAAELTAEKRNP